MKSDWKTAEFLEKYPLGYLPAFEDGDLHLNESGAIAEYGEFSSIILLRSSWAQRRAAAAESVWGFGPLTFYDETYTQLSLS